MDLKEANRIFWMEKGHLIPVHWDDQSIKSVYDSYFQRLWYKEETLYREEGFEEAWRQRCG